MAEREWDAEGYERFAKERRQPFDDLIAMCSPVPDGVVYDLGCGTGARTVDIPDALGARLVVGVDTSTSMLQRAWTLDRPDVRFEEGDFRAVDPGEPVDAIVSNAALHWVPDHAEVLAGWRRLLRAGGQLAVQVPVNFDHPSQRMIADVAADHPDWFGSEGPPELISASCETPERYAEILHDLGATSQEVVLRVYPHVLDDVAAVVDWLQGTTLRPYRSALSDERYTQMLDALSERLADHYGPGKRLLYTFKRILFHAVF